MAAKQYRWWLVMYHAGEEIYRHPADRWYDDLTECKKAAENLDFDFCCGYSFEIEERPAQQEQ